MNYIINKEDERAALITRKLIAGEPVEKHIEKLPQPWRKICEAITACPKDPHQRTQAFVEVSQDENDKEYYSEIVFTADLSKDIEEIIDRVAGPMSAAEILTTDFPEPVWAVNNLIPVGLTILAGKPKIGKSWMALQLSKEVSCGSTFLGERVKPGRVLYLALEDSYFRLQSRMKQQGWPSTQNAEFITLSDFYSNLGSLSNGGIEMLAELIGNGSHRLVVIDTLSRAFPGDQSDVAEMTSLLAPIQSLAHDQSIAILIIDHHRKSTGFDHDTITDVLGSTAKGAMADTIIGLYRQPGQQTAKLAFIGRDIQEVELNIAFSHSNGIWSLIDGSNGQVVTAVQGNVIDFLRRHGESKAKQIEDHIELEKGNTNRLLREMVANGLIDRTDSGRSVSYKPLPKGNDE